MNASEPLNSMIFTNKRGQTVFCEETKACFRGIRRMIHRIEIDDSRRRMLVTYSLLVHQQENGKWRFISETQDHNMQLCTARYILQPYSTLDALLADADLVARSGDWVLPEATVIGVAG